MNKVLCFGELLLRLPPANAGEWLRTNQMPVFVGGAELNVATALALWGMPVKYFTALPNNIIAKDIKQYLEQKNIDTTPINYSGERIGLYYLQQGSDMKSPDNVFDRKYSSFSTLETGVVNWDEILKDVSWFHFSAIAPAVSASAALLCKEALEAAHAKGITISVDLNYRSLLWQYGKKPIDIMPGLLSYCNVVMGNIWAANTLLDVPLDDSLIAIGTKDGYLAHATKTANFLFQKYPKCKWVANTFRFDANEPAIQYYAALNTLEQQAVSPVFSTSSVVDKVGSGDCFMAGLIYSIANEFQTDQIVSFAAAAAFGKLQERGDATQNSVQKINDILNRQLENV